ncbi:type IV inositol polyphosphate 5-phosphatase 9-like [Bidens hawaiensis]|uniref:type IV inositol polyphosphate 5-phosphatase 9-like n=1 Tax=Bidens hawaiensis TaxID=980011 RepID=UPI00404A5B6B
MWPRLVASKLLRKTLGSNNFVADFPVNASSFLDLPILDLEPVPSPKVLMTAHHDAQKFKIFVSTWNVGGVAPTEDLNIGDLLDTNNSTCDIYVFGFQEVVPLRASNVLGPDKKKISMKWNSLIRRTLNKNSHDRYCNNNKNNSNSNNNLSEKQLHVTKGKKKNTEYSMIRPEFRCLISKQMVGIMISVWVRSDLHPFFRNPSVSCVGCGIMGCLGNKGSVSVRFQFHETSFCFVCVHLASGGREGDERLRNSNVTEIISRTSFPTAMGPSLDLPATILDHDRVILLGDLNYRISLPESETRLLVNRKDWNTLLENDQLRMELMDGQSFETWHEGTISFAPTYKYQLNCDEYYGCGHLGTKPKKKRAPAWCDRIIWTGEGLKQLLYTRSETRLSDHRPVKAMFSVEVKVSRTRYQSICLSERFGRRPQTNLDFHSDDEYTGRLTLHIKSKMTP